MRIPLLKILAILAILGTCYLFLRPQAEISRFKELPVAVDDFEAINTENERTTYQKERGEATLIVLSASWCPTCLAEIPTLLNLHRSYSARGFKILMVSEDDNIKIAARFKKKHAFPWTVVHWNYDLMNKLGNPNVIPVSYLVRNDGKIETVKVGIFDEKEMRSSIERLLK